MGLAVADEGALPARRLEQARCGIGHDCAAPRGLPNRLAGFGRHSDDGTLAGARVRHWAFDKFRVILEVGQDHFVIAENGRGAAAMLADIRAEVALPGHFPLMIQRRKKVMIRFVPGHINAFGIHCRRGGGEAVVRMFDEG